MRLAPLLAAALLFACPAFAADVMRCPASEGGLFVPHDLTWIQEPTAEYYRIEAALSCEAPETYAAWATVFAAEARCEVGTDDMVWCRTPAAMPPDPTKWHRIRGCRRPTPDTEICSAEWQYEQPRVEACRVTAPWSYGRATLAAGDWFAYVRPVPNGGSKGAPPCSATQAVAPGTPLWAKDLGDGSNHFTAATAVAADAVGNIIAAGVFEGTVDFGGGAVTSAGYCDIYVAKYSPAGAYMWAKRYGGYPAALCVNAANGVAIDPANQDVLVTGSFQGTINFGGLPLVATLKDTFLLRLTSGGSHVASRNFVSTGSDQGLALAVGPSGIALTGYFSGSIDFGGGPLVSAGGPDIFVAKLSGTGGHVWSRRFGDAETQRGLSVAMDGAGNVVAGGVFKGTVDFGGGPYTSGVNPVSGPSTDGYLVKLAAATGAHVWSRQVGDTQGQEQEVRAVTVDATGAVLMTGFVRGTNENFGGGAGVPPRVGAADIFVAKYASGGGYTWAKRFGAAFSFIDNWPAGIATDQSGNIAITGSVSGPMDFGGGALPYPANSAATQAFIAELTPTGAHLWSRSLGDERFQDGKAIACDAGGNVVAAGSLAGTMAINGQTLSAPDGITTDGFVIKFTP